MNRLMLLLILALPGFSLMLRPGVWTMHDFHLFRQYEFNLCAGEGIFPCRWAPDATLGYGQPLFNFYGQLPYWLGQVFIIAGFQIIDSVKISFLLSLILSASSMYLLANHIWRSRTAALICALFYVYAPYRAVDVWVRGALPESLAFVFFPLILYFLETKKHLWFSISLALLLITHNLSLFIFTPFLGLWWLARSRDLKLIPAGILSLLLSSFYLLPVIFESRLVTLTQTTADYYSFPHHFTSLYQLFISRLWGYGGSVWGPNDTMSFSAGHLHWLLLFPIGILLIFKRNKLLTANYLLFTMLAVLALYLTHGKSEFIWKSVPGMGFIQFPWRFLSMSTFFLSLAAGAITIVSPLPVRASAAAGLALLLVLNAPFYRPDIWRTVTDRTQFSDKLWAEQIASAISDYWPRTASTLPDSPAPSFPRVLLGDAAVRAFSKGSHRQTLTIDVDTGYAKIAFPTVYFPGWTSTLDGNPGRVFPSGPLGLVTARIPAGRHTLDLEFRDTLVRTVGNLTSAAALLAVASMVLVKKKYA